MSLVHDDPSNALGSPLTPEELRDAQEKDPVVGSAPFTSVITRSPRDMI